MNTLTRREVAAGLVAGMLGAGPVARAAAGAEYKIISLVARKAELSSDRFRQHWLGIHGPMARKVPGLLGFVLSEAMQDSAAAAPAAPYPNRFDGIAQSWFDSREAMRSAMDAEAAKRWLADGNLFIDREASRNFFVSESVVVAPPRSEGGIKRTLLMVRKPGTTHEAFMAHWTGQHARLAQDVPGLLGCVFSRIEGSLGGRESPWAEVDGITEIWWDSGAANLGGRVVSPQSDRWAADGDAFIDRSRTRVIVSLEHVMVPFASTTGR
jgi:uncharacterized protein (TIGR02118 family)